MATHYDVLGVTASATPAQIRQAYYDRARELHPDGYAGRPDAELDAARRAMQDVNEAWRVLRDASTRAAYDQRVRTMAWQPAGPTSPVDGDWLDRPYAHRVAEPGDLTVAIVRAAPWIAVLIVLGAIFFFTAFARDRESREDLVGECVTIERATPLEVPCDEASDGRVVHVVDRENLCMDGTTARVVAGGDWYCLRPAGAG